MPRLSDTEIAQLKTEVSLHHLVESSGIDLKKHGKDYLGLCPFHDDKKPSLVISPDKNLWHCLGACNEGGDVIQWVMKREGLAFREAVARLRSGSAAGDNPVSKPPQNAMAHEDSTALAANPDDQALLRQIIDYYHATLKQSPKALDYLQERGLAHPELIERFQLGFADASLSKRLPESRVKAGAAVRSQLKRIGIIRPSGQTHFTGSLVIPVISPEGVIGEVYGRRIGNHNPGRPQHLYLPGAHQGVFNEAALAAADEIILCESLIDALTFWVAGYRHVTASYGTSGFTDDHLAAFKKYSIHRVLIAYDRDAAGDKAAVGLAERLTAVGIECFRVLFPKGMDANDYALQVLPAEKSLGVVLRSAQWVSGNPLSSGQRKSRETAAKTEKPAEPEPIPPLAAEPSEPVASELPEPTQASPQPPAAAAIPAEVSAREVNLTLGERCYRIRGLSKNLDFEQLKINLRVSRGELFHIDTLDLYMAKQRTAYIKHAALELSLEENLLKRDLGKVLSKLEALQDEQIRARQAPEKKTVITLSKSEREAALRLLRSPDLMQRIAADIERCGVVGEATNSQAAYLACLSRKLERPLALIIQSSSAAGKSALMDAVLAFMPAEERIQYSAMTGQSLFYLGETDLKHKILAIAEEQGVKEASYALKLLQSQGELTIASTGKDATTGQLVTQEYRVEGPVMLFLTTTAIDLDEELKNRCLLLSVDESREQTRAIQQRQRFEETLEGLLADRDRSAILGLHRNAQRLLRPMKVVNPYAERLTFLDERTRTRRDHKKYLSLIKSIALLHQYQRETKNVQREGETLPYIEVTPGDIEIANRLAHEVLGRTLDELPPQTRRLLGLIHEQVKARCQAEAMDQADYRFSRRAVREHTAWGNTQLKIHLKRLEELEYLIVHRGGRGQSFVYELAYQGEGSDGAPFLIGLLDVQALKSANPAADPVNPVTNLSGRGKKSGQDANLSGPSRPQVAPKSGGCRVGKNPDKPVKPSTCEETAENRQKRTSTGKKNSVASPRLTDPALAAQIEVTQVR